MSPVAIMMWGMIAILMVGIPAAFAMGLAGTLFFAVSRGIDNLPYELITQRVVNGIDSFPLLAIPLFLLVGQLMNESGATTRLFKFCDALVGHVRGGLGHVNVLGSMLFAGMSGSGTADAAGLGAIEIRAMRDAGYDDRFTIGLTSGSALIGPIIPPSIGAVLYAILADVSAGRVLIAGAIPGLLMGLAMMAMVAWLSYKRGYPTRPFAGWCAVWAGFRDSFGALLTPVILIGGILLGYFTATEAAAVAAVWALLLSVFIHRTLGLAAVIRVFRRATVDSAVIMFILACSALFGWILTRTKMPDQVAEWITGMTAEPVLIMAMIIAFLLFIGCFMAVAVAINILTPILVPVIVTLGFDPVHFGVVMIMVLVIGEVTPPFGMVLYVVTRVSGRPFDFVVRASLPWLAVIFAVTLLVAAVPDLALWLPNTLMD